MAHIKKYWGFYLGLLLLVLIAYEMKWFGNKTTLFCGGGTISSSLNPYPQV